MLPTTLIVFAWTLDIVPNIVQAGVVFLEEGRSANMHAKTSVTSHKEEVVAY